MTDLENRGKLLRPKPKEFVLRRLLPIVVIAATLIQVSQSTVAAKPPTAPRARHVVPDRGHDFNGDGFPDLAIGVPLDGADVGSVVDMYGSGRGLTGFGGHEWSQNTPGILGTSGIGDLLGEDVATGDFNGDGYGDIAAGAMTDSEPSKYAGVVNLVYGSSAGLSADGNQLLSQGSAGMGGDAGPDWFGAAVAAGDFDGDGFDDLAVGAAGESLEGLSGAGQVDVIYGSNAGLMRDRSQSWTQDSEGIMEEAESWEGFGARLEAGDFDADGFEDLAIGTVSESVGTAGAAGAVNVIFGSRTGLSADGNQLWSQDSDGIKDQSEYGDEFGYGLGAGDLNGDGFDDLAVGSVGEDGGADTDLAGAVNVIFGSAAGLTAEGNQLWSQNSEGILERAEKWDLFGSAFAVGDLDADGYGDLAIGALGETVHNQSFAGAAHVLFGSPAGPQSDRNQVWAQDSPGILGVSGQADDFGGSLVARDFDQDGFVDLAVGVWGEDVRGFEGAGAINVLYGSGTGLTDAGNQLWTQASPGVGGTLSASFGASLG